MLYYCSFLFYYSFKVFNTLLYSILDIFKCVLFFFVQSLIPVNLRRLNRKTNRCYIIMTGPSLNREQLLNIGNDDVITASAFWKHPIAVSLNIVAYVFYDANYFELSEKAFNFFDNLRSKLKVVDIWAPSHLVLPENLKFLRSRGFSITRTHHFPFNLKDGNMIGFWPGFAGVSAYALMIAIHAGYKEIVLLGFDHDYLANRGVDRHFYVGPTIEGTDDIPMRDRIKYYQEMKNNLKLWDNYLFIAKLAKRKKIDIINGTPNSYLDVFPFCS
jgi:hypothetical protein